MQSGDQVTVSEIAKPAWSPTGIAWICLLFSLLPAGIMYALNFERLGQPKKKKRTLYFVLPVAVIYYYFVIRFSVLIHDANRATQVTDRMWFNLINISLGWSLYLSQQTLFAQYMRRGCRKAPLLIPLIASALWIVTVAVGSSFYSVDREQKEFANAVVLSEKKRFQEAEPIFKRYKNNNPTETEPYWNLAIIYAETERVELAKQELKELLQIEPNHEEAKQFLQELQNL